MAKVHPNTAIPVLELQRLAACCEGGKGAGREEENAAVLTVWRKSLLFSCSGFTVFDAEGNLVFRVDNYDSGNNREVVLMDADGKPLLTGRRKKLSLGENWMIYMGEDMANPIYSVKKHVKLLHSKAALAHATPCRRGGAVSSYQVEGSYSRRSCIVYDERRREVAEIRRKETAGGVAFGPDVYRLVVHSDIATCLAMAIVVVLDQMFGSRMRLIKDASDQGLRSHVGARPFEGSLSHHWVSYNMGLQFTCGLRVFFFTNHIQR